MPALRLGDSALRRCQLVVELRHGACAGVELGEVVTGAREVDDNEAKDILNQEKTDKQRRQGNINRGYRPVPKDW